MEEIMLSLGNDGRGWVLDTGFSDFLCGGAFD